MFQKIKQYISYVWARNDDTVEEFLNKRSENNKLKNIVVGMSLFFRNKRKYKKVDQEIRLLKHSKSNIYRFNKKEVDVAMYMPDVFSSHDFIQYQIMITGRFFEDKYLDFINSNYIKPGMNIVDCGANIGNHTIYFSLIGKASKVTSFEMTPSTFDILKKNIALNKLGNKVTVYNVALGEENKKVSAEIVDPNNFGSNRVKESGNGNIDMVTLDEMINDKVDFLKIDVEGYEYHVLSGADRILKEDKPIIMIEIFDKNFNAVNELLHRYRYSGKHYGDADYIYTIEA